MSHFHDVSLSIHNAMEHAKLSGRRRGPVAFSCTDTPATVAVILTTVTGRSSLEAAVRDVEEELPPAEERRPSLAS